MKKKKKSTKILFVNDFSSIVRDDFSTLEKEACS